LDFVPEHIAKKKSSFRNILDTLGSIFHEMLTGKSPKHGKCTYTGKYAPVIQKCIDKNPENQYSSIEEMKEGLDHAKKHGSKTGNQDAASIPFWLTIPFQGTILAFEWVLIAFFYAGGSPSTMSLFVIAFLLHSMIYLFRRHTFMKKNNVHLGAARTVLPFLALAAILAVLFFLVVHFLA
jgi:hypothetical protein